MQGSIKFCPRCSTQNNLSAAFCQSCGVQFQAQHFPRSPQTWKSAFSPMLVIVLAFFGCCAVGSIAMLSRSDETSPRTSLENSPASSSGTRREPTPTAPTLGSRGGGERMVLDNAQITVYVECTHQEWRKYKIRFIVKKSGSPFLTPILRQIGNPKVYSVVVNGVDPGDDFAFSSNIAAFNSSGDLIPGTFVSRPLNGNVALGYAYHDLVVKYERGN